MNKYFSKALFYGEKRNRMFALYAFLITYLYGIYEILVNLYAGKNDKLFSPPSPALIISQSLSTFIFIVLISVIGSYFEKSKRYSFMLTQPYCRDSIIITKTISLMLSYIIPTIAYGLICSIILTISKQYYYFHGKNISSYYNTSVKELLLSMLFVIAVLTFVLVLLQFLQVCFGMSISGVILPFIMLMALSTLSKMLSYFTSRKLGVLRSFWDFLNNIVFIDGPALVSSINGVPESKSLHDIFIEYRMGFNPLVSLALILVSALLLYITTLLNRKIKAENTSNIFLFKFTQVTFKAVFSFFTAVMLSLAFSAILYYLVSKILGQNLYTYLMYKYGIDGKENIEHTIYLILNILWIPLTMLAYNLFGKVMDKRRIY